ncbi:transcriptional regulator [Paenibacillus faecis]|nr:transcriptional regulator [Paenibacillus faecis]
MTYYIFNKTFQARGGTPIRPAIGQNEKKAEGSTIKLTSRQMEIVDIVKKHAPITGEQIAEMLNLTRPTIRSDLSVLVMLDYIDAKPKVGYFLGKRALSENENRLKLLDMKVGDVHGVPVVVRETTTIHDAVVTLFLENVGHLIVTDEEGRLAGIVSRKDLLKVTLGNASASTMPVSFIMTRRPNVITVSPEDTVLEAARIIIAHQVDSLPVVVPAASGGEGELNVVGRISKTNIIKMLLDTLEEK